MGVVRSLGTKASGSGAKKPLWEDSLGNGAIIVRPAEEGSTPWMRL